MWARMNASTASSRTRRIVVTKYANQERKYKPKTNEQENDQHGNYSLINLETSQSMLPR